jgi:hypothetical protein
MNDGDGAPHHMSGSYSCHESNPSAFAAYDYEDLSSKVERLEDIIRALSARLDKADGRETARSRLAVKVTQEIELTAAVDAPTDGPVADDAELKLRAMLNDNYNDAVQTYYGFVQARLIAANEARVPAWRHAFSVAFCVAVMFMKLVSLHSVKDFVSLIAEWHDDEIFGWGERPRYTYFQAVYASISWVAVPTAFTIVLCSGVVCLSIAERVRHVVAMSVLIASELQTARRGAWPRARLAAAVAIQQMRICVIVQFVSASAFLIGTGDGPINVVLNALAMRYLIDVDSLIISCGASLVPNPAPVDLSRTWAKPVDTIAKRPAWSRSVTDAAHHGIIAVGLLTVIACGWTYQSKTSWGGRFEFKGDAHIDAPWAQMNNCTRVYLGTVWAFMITLAFATTLCGAVAWERPPWPRLVLAAAVNTVVVCALYSFLVEHLIQQVIMAWKEPGELHDCGAGCREVYGRGDIAEEAP